MTFEEFDTFQLELIKEVLHMKDTKGKEYANSEDRFANFRRLSAELGITDYQIGWVYCKKHLDSIAQFLRTGQTHSTETIRSRFVDAITYMCLIAGMVQEMEDLRALESKQQAVTGQGPELFGEPAKRPQQIAGEAPILRRAHTTSGI